MNFKSKICVSIITTLFIIGNLQFAATSVFASNEDPQWRIGDSWFMEGVAKDNTGEIQGTFNQTNTIINQTTFFNSDAYMINTSSLFSEEMPVNYLFYYNYFSTDTFTAIGSYYHQKISDGTEEINTIVKNYISDNGILFPYETGNFTFNRSSLTEQQHYDDQGEAYSGTINTTTTMNMLITEESISTKTATYDCWKIIYRNLYSSMYGEFQTDEGENGTVIGEQIYFTNGTMSINYNGTVITVGTYFNQTSWIAKSLHIPVKTLDYIGEYVYSTELSKISYSGKSTPGFFFLSGILGVVSISLIKKKK